MKAEFTERTILTVLLALLIIIMPQCTSAPEWQKKNNELIKQNALTVRTIKGLPKTGITSNLEAGKVTNLESLPATTLYPGVNAKLYWGTGVMTCVLNLDPNTQIPEETLPVDRFMFVLEGEVNQLIDGVNIKMIALKREEQDGTHSGTPRIDLVYLEKGSKNALTAGPAGAKIIEVYSPVRLDYLQKAGAENIPQSNADISGPATPNIKPNQVYDLYDFQLTGLTTGANSRLITGKNVQISFISMDPGALFDKHIHPEEQTMFVLRGGCNEILMDSEQPMAKDDVVLIPGNMVHGAKVGDLGCDAIDIFWPARADYSEKEKARLEAFHAIIPEGAKPELIVDGKVTKPSLTFAEGPKWLNGKVYFSNMFFDQNWNGDPKKSSLVELNPDGSYRNIVEGKMQTNGLYPYKNGNLLVCDMFGHRVIEMTTKGEVVRVVAD
ncbi:MAG: cupin domain-containing protein, partial [Bacteroidales bacterium]|nr:cupin domain-containing protein [Bacteroidales bacterium]